MIDSYTKNKWDQIDTVQDLLDFMEDPKCDVMGMSNALVDIDKSSFWDFKMQCMSFRSNSLKTMK